MRKGKSGGVESKKKSGQWTHLGRLFLLCAFAAALLGLSPRTVYAERSARGDYDWGLTLYGGYLTEATLGEIITLDLQLDQDLAT